MTPRHWRERMAEEYGGPMYVTLPLPPSANRYWRAVVKNGRAVNVLSEAGRKYKDHAALLGAAQNTRLIRGPVCVTGIVYFPNKRGDLDNRIKPTLDALSGICYEDDKQVSELRFLRDTDKDNPRVEVKVEEAA